MVSCMTTSTSYPENIPDIGIETERLNQQLIVSAPTGWNSFKTTDPISLEIRAHGSDLISFNPENVILFVKDKGS